jgi:hypothetical protein
VFPNWYLETFCSYGRVDELVYFAGLKEQHEIVVHHYIQQGEARKALEVLQRHNVLVDLVVHNGFTFIL